MEENIAQLIKDFLNDKEDIKDVVNHLKKLMERGYVIIDTEYRSLGIRLEERKFERYIKENNILEVKVKYTISILLNMLQNIIRNEDLDSHLEESFKKQNSFLVSEIEGNIIDKELVENILFRFNCLNNRLNFYDDQIIKKEVNGHNMTTALIKLNMITSINEENKEIMFESNKDELGRLIESLEELYTKL